MQIAGHFVNYDFVLRGSGDALRSRREVCCDEGAVKQRALHARGAYTAARSGWRLPDLDYVCLPKPSSAQPDLSAA
eukprot:4854848-Pyramimonas_sp.AAC.1